MTNRPGTVFTDRYGLRVAKSWVLSRRKSESDTLFDAETGGDDEAGVGAGGGGGRATFQPKLSDT